jgi:hypothetical protein
MKRPRTVSLCLAALLGSGASAASTKPAPAPDMVMLVTQSRVEVDANGQVTAIQTTPALPPDAAQVIEGNLRRMRFAPPMKNGQAVAGVTYAAQEACAAPEGGAYRFAVKFRGNGPGLKERVFPIYPRDAVRAGAESTWKLNLLVGTDGSATLVDATRTDDSKRKRYDRDFRKALAAWVAAMQYQPEELDHQRVATRLERSVSFTLHAPMYRLGSRELAQAQAEANESCALALKKSDAVDRDIALDSPLRLLPAAGTN